MVSIARLLGLRGPLKRPKRLPNQARANPVGIDISAATARGGHLEVMCGTPGCSERWQRPLHEPLGILGHHQPDTSGMSQAASAN
jgi:hypothetical protein